MLPCQMGEQCIENDCPVQTSKTSSRWGNEQTNKVLGNKERLAKRMEFRIATKLIASGNDSMTLIANRWLMA